MTIDLDGIKGRFAEALVEGIFKRAGYQVSRLGRGSHVQRLVKIGPDEFLPDFLVWKPVDGVDSERPLYRVLTVEVRYRANLGDFLKRYGAAVFSTLREQWPDLYFVFVTDNLEGERSCFQVVDLREVTPGGESMTTDLYQRQELGIWRKTVEEYESLVMQVFPLLRQAGWVKT